MTEDITIGEKEFKAIQVLNLTETADVPVHKTEAQFPISDHVSLKPTEFSIDIELLKDEGEVEVLDALFDGKEPFELVTGMGVFSDMIIQTLNYTQGGNITTIRASVRLKQILKAAAKTTTIELPITIAEEQLKGGDTPTEPEMKENEAAKSEAPDEEKSWLETIGSWFS